ncbi:MAG: CDP-alcohol phosphatidyltransferase family protein [Nitrospiraceae bacterium]|nr:CDP-alcohol phosphatidyltransferase family protein [Nitrospiraceae bacterium]
MNLPNTITLIRVVLIPFFVDLMIYEYYRHALVVFLAACLTDALDGMIARLTNTKTELGAFLDPMADKLLIVSSFVTLAILAPFPVWLVITVVSRDVILTLGSMVIYFTGHDLKVKPSIIGKMTTFLQLLVVTLTLIHVAYGISSGYLHAVYWATAGMTIASGVQYVLRGMKIMA